MSPTKEIRATLAAKYAADILSRLLRANMAVEHAVRTERPPARIAELTAKRDRLQTRHAEAQAKAERQAAAARPKTPEELQELRAREATRLRSRVASVTNPGSLTRAPMNTVCLLNNRLCWVDTQTPVPVEPRPLSEGGTVITSMNVPRMCVIDGLRFPYDILTRALRFNQASIIYDYWYDNLATYTNFPAVDEDIAVMHYDYKMHPRTIAAYLGVMPRTIDPRIANLDMWLPPDAKTTPEGIQAWLRHRRTRAMETGLGHPRLTP